jgi:uncharacterized protein
MSAADGRTWVRYFVHGVDREDVDEQLEELAESHWTYIDGHADALVARGPTLSTDGTSHTGSVHVVEAATIDDARRFALEEPYWLADIYASVTVSRFRSAEAGTMWDRPSQHAGSASSLVLVRWPGQSRSSAGGADRKLLRTLARTDALVFGGLLISDDGTQSVGLVAAVDADIGRAAAFVAALGLPGSTTSVTSLRWRRGGRQTPREHPRQPRREP